MTEGADPRQRLDSDVLSRAITGDRFALGELWTAWNASLVRFLRSLRVEEPDDVAAEVWVDLARRMPDVGPDPEAFRRLLFTIGRRRAIDARRFRLRRPVWLSDPHDHRQISGSDPQVDTQVEAEQIVQDLLAKLPRAHAEVIALRVVAGFNVAETADITGRSEGAVRQMAMRALRELKEHATEMGFGSDEASEKEICDFGVTN